MVGGRGSQHHLIVVADVEGFGDPRRTGPHQRAVREGLYEVMASAFTAGGTTWEACYREDRGDAVFALVPAATDKTAFVEAVLPHLVTRLRVHNDTHPDPEQIRLRVSLHAGEVAYDQHGVTSTALTLAFRLCDAPPLKTALATSPGVLAVIASDWLFDEVVRHLPAAAPATWRSVPVIVKEATTTGWLSLPDHPYPPDPAPAPPSSDAPAVTRSRTGSGGVVPRQLPAAVRDFTGRAEHLAALDALIPPAPDLESLDKQATRSVVITAVDGAGGIGKTTLALYWAHRIQDRFPDGTLHVNLRGYGPGEPVTATEALGGFLRALNVAPRAIPAEVEAQAALLRSLLAGKRLLMVLDNAHSAEQIRPLLPGTPGCMVVITSRDSLTGLIVTDAAHRLTLDLLTNPEALDLVTSIIGTDRAATDTDAIDELIRRCTRLPLALRIAASRAAAHPHMRVADVVTELADDHTRLDILSDTGDERAAVRVVFDWSYKHLAPEQARLFRRLGLHPGPDLSLPAAAALAELPPADARPLLSALTAAHLIEPTAGGRYRFHDLLRAYAAEQARHHDTPEDCDRAVDAVLTWYTHTIYTAEDLYVPGIDEGQRAPVVAEPAYPHAFANAEEAWKWVRHTESANLFAAFQYTIDKKLDHYTLALAFSSAGGARNWYENCKAGIIAARRLGDRSREADLIVHCAQNLALKKDSDKPIQADLDRVKALVEQLNDNKLRMPLLNANGLLCLKQGHFDEGIQWFNRLLTLSQEMSDRVWESIAEHHLSSIHLTLGHYKLALEHNERGIDLRRQAGHRTGEAGALTQQARIWWAQGDLDKVITLCRDAIAIGYSMLVNRRQNVAQPLELLAASLHQLGRTNEAMTSWQQAATIYDDAGFSQEAAEVRQRLHDVQKRSGRDQIPGI